MQRRFAPARVFAWSICTALLVGVCPRAHAGQWRELGPAPISTGPFSGRISAIATSPVSESTWWVAGASGGIWRTTDGGSTWTPLTDHLPTTAIGALAVDPASDSILYAGSGEANFAFHSFYGLGLYKSTDGGDSWQVLAGETFAGRTFSRIVVSYADPATLYAAVTRAGGFPALSAAKDHPMAEGPVGVFRSTNAGATWEHLTIGVPAGPASDVAIHPTNPAILYAAIGDIFGSAENGVYRSIDGGESWTRVSAVIPEVDWGRAALAVTPAMPNRVYAFVSQTSDGVGAGAATKALYRSDTMGDAWVTLSPGNIQAFFGWYVDVVAAHPTQADTVFIGGVTLLRSTTAGTAWTDVTPPHVDMHALAFTSFQRLLCGNDGGVHRSTNNGTSWTHRNTGLGVVQFYPGISIHPANEHFVLAGAQDNGTNRRTTDSLTWTRRIDGDGGFTALHPAAPNTMFGELQGTGNLFRSLDGGNSFQFAATGIVGTDRNCFLPPVVFLPGSSTTLLYGTHRIYRSTNTGALWSPISGDLTLGSPAAVRCIAPAPSDPAVVYASTTDGRVMLSTDGGVEWDEVRYSPEDAYARVRRELAVNPERADEVYYVRARFGTAQVLRSTNFGEEWTVAGGNLPDVPVNCVAVGYQDSMKVVFVGTDQGVYRSAGGGTLWSEVGSLAHVPVTDVVIDDARRRLVAGTMGRGVWEIAMPITADADRDDDRDLFDVAAFQNCFTGSISEDPTPLTAECRDAFNLDSDNDADLADAALWFNELTGPGSATPVP